jgi:hypothetical protein
LITTFAVAGETQPNELVTVKLYVPVARAVIIADVPDPGIFPGLIVQLPAGKPLSATLPVARAHAGWVIAPTTGAVGMTG